MASKAFKFAAQHVLQTYSSCRLVKFLLPTCAQPLTLPDPVEADTKQQPKPFATIQASTENLDAISKFAPSMRWDMSRGDQASNILEARLRAKYYGARVITYRPFVLEIMALSAQGTPSPEGQFGNEYKQSVNAPNINKNAKNIDDIDPETIRYAREGVRALILSTEAFYSVVSDVGTERFIVTNIWGTAHAYVLPNPSLPSPIINHEQAMGQRPHSLGSL